MICTLMGLLALVADIACQGFPPGFKFGAATSAYQIEGAWNVRDKGKSIWDHLLHTRPDFVSDRSNGDVACDSYHLWREDVGLAEDLGLDFYRFSISWPRLLPSGFSDQISADGRRYYGELIAELRARGIAPVVTIHHFDLPQRLQHLGGWTNPLIVDWFADYARVVFSLYAGQVETWITINEPVTMCDTGYRAILAPGFNDSDIGALLCSKYILLAHAAAYRIYEEEFKPIYGGEVSLAMQEYWYEPKNDEDLELTLLARDYAFGRFSHPVFSAAGGWPPLLEAYMAEKSRKEGYPRSRLPAFTPEEIQLLKVVLTGRAISLAFNELLRDQNGGSYDFFALNHYTSRTVRTAEPGEPIGTFLLNGLDEIGAVLETRPHWGSAPRWITINPEGLRNVLNWNRHLYGDMKFLISENGFLDTGDDLNDTQRVEYFKGYLEQVLLAITEDKLDVAGYTAWSLIDNFEWYAGYESRLGLHYVDFTDPRRPRIPKASARYYKSVVRARSLDVGNIYRNVGQEMSVQSGPFSWHLGDLCLIIEDTHVGK